MFGQLQITETNRRTELLQVSFAQSIANPQQNRKNCIIKVRNDDGTGLQGDKAVSFKL